jgi:beta-glucosidase
MRPTPKVEAAVSEDDAASPTSNRPSPGGSSTRRIVFPSDFVWGTATSSYQIEGAISADGRGESIWDRFCRRPGAILDGSNADVACDHYHRFRDDVAVMRDLGIRAYRFSIAWPRIFPRGRGQVSAAGLDFYSRLVDCLLENGITPFPTLYHWDLPQALQDEGGWAKRETAEAFVGYAEAVARRLGDRVSRWITHNEPWCISLLSHQLGKHAPGITDWPTALAVAHHVLLSHGWAVPVIRRECRGAEVGITLNFEPSVAASGSAADRNAARHDDGSFNRWFLDPVFGRRYPADMVADYAAAGHIPASGVPAVRDGDFEAIAVPTDFLGVNYYTRKISRATIPEAQNDPPTVIGAPDSERTTMGWEVHEQTFYELLCRIHFDYRPKRIYVTENGSAWTDTVSPDGRVHDARRTAYLRGHLAAVGRAALAGAPMAGYFAWSLLDNFEWERGYTQRFGIVRVDYDTQKRTPKDSALYYRDVIAAGAVEEG